VSVRAPRRLVVLYDARCSVCTRARDWLGRQAKYVPMDFVAAGSAEARRRFPTLDPAATLEEMTVVGDGGEVYLGAKGWVICLWALREYRALALELGKPARLATARRFVAWFSRNRFRFGLVPRVHWG
jgi:predicted DCC family thiol-disulfide oxidoreductase YuxK